MSIDDDNAVTAHLDPDGVAPQRVDANRLDLADDDLFDESWTAPRRFSRITAVLVAGLVAAGGFAGGAYVQRSHDQGLTPTTSGRAAGAGFGGAFAGGQLPSGFPSGGFAGTGTAAAPAAAGAAAPAASAPVVVGTVSAVTASSITVKNFGGVSVVVRVPATATVTVTGLGGLRIGATVAVTGTKAVDGSVTATTIVSRRAA